MTWWLGFLCGLVGAVSAFVVVTGMLRRRRVQARREAALDAMRDMDWLTEAAQPGFKDRAWSGEASEPDNLAD